MKYTTSNPPPLCLLTQSTCYKGTRTFVPKGVLWHSTGANNPNLKRYVQPSDDAPDRDEWLKKLGRNIYGNDWNHIKREAGMQAFIGKLADGTVTAVQTLPLHYRPWGCGSGPKGSLNDTHMQFEICEDNLKDKDYFFAVYAEALELTAYMCKYANIDPLGFIDYKGLKVPTIIDHWGSHLIGCGSNHGDLSDSGQWFLRYGITLDDVRHDVADLLKGSSSVKPAPAPAPSVDDLPTLNFGKQDRATRGTVAYLQRKLNATGAKLDVDGDFGNKTKQAVIQFQIDNNLTADGIVGPKTWGALES